MSTAESAVLTAQTTEVTMPTKSQSAPPKPPTAPDVAATHTRPAPNQPDTANVQVPGGFAVEVASAEAFNTNDTRHHSPDVNIKGAEPAVNNLEQQLTALLGSDVLQQMINVGVQQQLAQLGVQRAAVPEDSVSDAPGFEFIKHYRNDVSTELMIPELDMDADVPRLTPTGGYIRFRRGHFFATTENQVKQIEWMMNTAEHSADTRTSLGGNAAIYEDSGEQLFYCTAGCSRGEFHTADRKRYVAHMRAVHGVEL